MKKIHVNIALAGAALLLGACTPFTVNENTIVFRIDRIRSEKAWVEVYPEMNDFYYIYGAVSADEYSTYRSDKDFIKKDFEEQQQLCKDLNELFEEYGYPTASLEELLFYKGIADEMIDGLKPQTDYYAYAYCLDSRHKPIYTLVKQPFTTTEKPHSDIQFEVTMASNDTFTITPSNSDTYYWEAVSKQAVFDYYEADIADTSYTASIMVPTWFSGVLYLNYKWDFELVSEGEQKVALSSFAEDIQDGDVFYAGCVGFTTEETTDESLYEIVYHTDLLSEIRKVDSWYDETDNATKKRQFKQALFFPRNKKKRGTIVDYPLFHDRLFIP